MNNMMAAENGYEETKFTIYTMNKRSSYLVIESEENDSFVINKKESEIKWRYKCNVNNCPAGGFRDLKTEKFYRNKKSHASHPSQRVNTGVYILKCALLNAADEDNDMEPLNLYTRISNLPQHREFKEYLPFKKIANAIYSRRRKEMEPIPESFAKLIEGLKKQHIKNLLTIEGEILLKGVIGDPNSLEKNHQRALIFYNEAFAEKLEKNELFVDATFKCVPKVNF